MGFRQCLPLRVVQLKGKQCRKPHCHNGVVDTFGPWGLQVWPIGLYNRALSLKYSIRLRKKSLGQGQGQNQNTWQNTQFHYTPIWPSHSKAWKTTKYTRTHPTRGTSVISGSNSYFFFKPRHIFTHTPGMMNIFISIFLNELVQFELKIIFRQLVSTFHIFCQTDPSHTISTQSLQKYSAKPHFRIRRLCHFFPSYMTFALSFIFFLNFWGLRKFYVCC